MNTSQALIFRLLLAATIASVTGCGAGADAVAQSGRPAQQEGVGGTDVTTVAVVSRMFERTLPLPGDLVAFQDVDIHAKVQGFIEEISVDRGSVVSRSEVLARIEAPELRQQLLEAQAQLASRRATFERLTQAAATPGVVAQHDVDIAAAEVDGAQARVEELRDMTAYLEIAAPFDGVVTERAAHVGSLVGPGAGSLVRMQQVSPLRLVTAVPEAYVGGIRPGDSIRFTVPAYPGQAFTGTVTRVAHALDRHTRTMAVELDVPNNDGRLAPGMFTNVEWPARRAEASLFVPRSALVITTERIFVIRVRDGVAEWVDVRRGAGMEDLVEVTGALEAGDDVVARGTDELRDGTRVSAVR